MGKIIAIASGKGGTGKTFLALNLGLALTNLGKKVTLIDTNFVSPHVSLFLGQELLVNHLGDALNKRKKIEQCVYNYEGLRFIPLRQERVNLKSMNEIEKLREFNDFIILDCGSGFGMEVVAPIKIADEVLIVINPEFSSIAEGLKIMRIADTLGKVVKFVVNKYEKEILHEEIKKIVKKEIIGFINEDKKIKRSILERRPLLLSFPKARVNKQIFNIASKLIGQNGKRSFLEKIKRMLRSK